ncbi:MAG: c-type cytochrome [Balneolaceae bacterium]|nr:c-type cytochrome [Balneolaceae bacterium]
MKTLLIPILTMLFGWGYMNYNAPILTSKTDVVEADTSDFDQAAAIAAIKEAIAGKEEMPASEVFKNLELMGEFPAGRITAIMEFGFSNSLGVTCTHCHNPDDWSSDEKIEKKITREMWKMTGRLNSEILPGIEELSDRTATVNCTTCHRGDVKPATRMN